MTAILFMDTETTGLSLDDDVWEFAAIRREPGGTETEHHMFIHHDERKCRELPEAFRKDHLSRWPGTAQATPRHYHLIDVENLAVGYLAGLARYVHSEGACGPLCGQGGAALISPPWDSDALSRAVGVEPPTDERHTAMGDARWARAIYDAVINGKP